MSDVNINKSIEHMNESPIEDIEDGEIVFEDGAFNGFEGQSITINETAATQGDLQAGIEFIYHMR